MHFSGERAFDDHRIGEYGGPIETAEHEVRYDPCTRRCGSPEEMVAENGEPHFIPATTDGRCTVYADREGYGPEYGIVIWRPNPAARGPRTLEGSDGV